MMSEKKIWFWFLATCHIDIMIYSRVQYKLMLFAQIGTENQR